jgi:hypothetical protein
LAKSFGGVLRNLQELRRGSGLGPRGTRSAQQTQKQSKTIAVEHARV